LRRRRRCAVHAALMLSGIRSCVCERGCCAGAGCGGWGGKTREQNHASVSPASQDESLTNTWATLPCIQPPVDVARGKGNRILSLRRVRLSQRGGSGGQGGTKMGRADRITTGDIGSTACTSDQLLCRAHASSRFCVVGRIRTRWLGACSRETPSPSRCWLWPPRTAQPSAGQTSQSASPLQGAAASWGVGGVRDAHSLSGLGRTRGACAQVEVGYGWRGNAYTGSGGWDGINLVVEDDGADVGLLLQRLVVAGGLCLDACSTRRGRGAGSLSAIASVTPNRSVRNHCDEEALRRKWTN